MTQWLAWIFAVKKERKHYHLDWTLVPENGPRFENLVACHLAKWVEFAKRSGGDVANPVPLTGRRGRGETDDTAARGKAMGRNGLGCPSNAESLGW